MSRRIFIANVGVNASHGLKSPIFENGLFEFIPIPEKSARPGRFTLSYSDLRSFYSPRESLLKYIPARYQGMAVHNDPEFSTFTYGDNCDKPGRAAGLKSVEAGDIILFYARLVSHDRTQFIGDAGFYFIGFIEVSLVVRNVTSKPSAETLSEISNNAHIRRGLSDPSRFDGFWVLKGSERSSRFRVAVPITRELVERLFSTAKGHPWKWDARKSVLQVIGSYMRTCRCYLDTGDQTGADKTKLLWTQICRYNPESNAFTVF